MAYAEYDSAGKKMIRERQLVDFRETDDDFYATLLQLGLEPVTKTNVSTQTEVVTCDASTQTEKPKVLWGYF